MTVFLWKQKTSYMAVPKAACTSVKAMLFSYENQRPWRSFQINGKLVHIHKMYPAILFPKLPTRRIADHERLALIRDPVRRLLSCYSNRVVHHRELSKEKAGAALAQFDLPENPSLDQFIDRLEDYAAAVPSIQHHARPMVDYLGRDPSYFAGLYSMDRIPDFLAHLQWRLGQEMTLPRLQTGGPKLDPSMLNEARLSALKRYYEEDYDVFGGWL